MQHKLLLILSLNLTFALNGFTQTIKKLDFSMTGLMSLAAQDSCNEVLPAPALNNKPRYVAGNENTICFKLPDRTLIPFKKNEILNPFVLTVIRNLSTGELFQFPRSVNLEIDSVVVEIVQSLSANTDYAYSTALFVPVCKIDCGQVVDNSQLELYCSAYEDTVFSHQDSEVPDLTNISISQLSESSVPGWINSDFVNIAGRLFDFAGVWQAKLYQRSCRQETWILASDSTYSGILSDSGFVFENENRFSFRKKLSDGCYEFRIEGVDATHSPESCAPNFELVGNENVPQQSAQPHIELNVDTQPPDSVELSCSQILNSIELRWAISRDADAGIGLAGYQIFRDGELIASTRADQLQFLDEFTENTPDTEFTYQIQPYDSLGNIQTIGGIRACSFTRFSPVKMVAEPEFSAGDTNEVCWNGSEQIDIYTVFIAVNSDFGNAVSQSVSDTCFVFRNLQNGATYSYWVKAVDRQQRIVFSDTVHSIQDASLPEISSFEIPDLISLNGLSWVRSREITLNISSADFVPGHLDSLEIVENGETRFSQKLQTGELLNAEINYLIETQNCSDIELFTKIYDAAGNVSLSEPLLFILDDSSPAPVTGLECVQMSMKNGIELRWTIPENIDNCSGLAGFKIIRDGQKIDEISPDVLFYEDIFETDAPGGTFTYQVQPFDSLGNLQAEGGLATCDYIGTSSLTIQPLPLFTQGLTTNICWSIEGALDFLNLYIDANCDSVADDSVLIQTPSAENCYAVVNLEDGQKYCFWLSGMDAQHRQVQSSMVSTMQDNTPPVIQTFTFPAGEILNGRIWTYSREMELRVEAFDFNDGQIWTYIIEEGAIGSQEGTFSDSLTAQNEIIAYQIKSTARKSTQIDLKLKVVDGAGNESEYVDLVLYFQESSPDMFAFPNPFNPLRESLTIRLNKTVENELKIYDFFGNLVTTITQKSNAHDFTWDGRNGDDQMVANGGYICVGVNTKTRFKIGVVKQN